MRLLRAVMKERKVTRSDIIRLEKSLRKEERLRVRVSERIEWDRVTDGVR
jgi:hypothetical protein